MTLAASRNSAATSRPIPCRRQFLDDLVAGLTVYEWRYLRDRLMQRHYHFDVLGQLPLDLALCVVAYLDPLDVVALRQVSKRWHSQLTAKEVLKQAYVTCWPWPKLPNVSNWTEHLDQRLCCEHSLAQGRPWSKAEYSDVFLDLPSAYFPYWQLHGSNFAWCGTTASHDLREHIAVLSLGTGKVSRYFPASRSPLRAESLALSDILVGCLSTDGNCEIFEIAEGTCHSFRLPSTRYQKLVLQSDKIACINMNTNLPNSMDFLDIITWNLKSKAHRQTSLDVHMEWDMDWKRTLDSKFKRLEWVLGYDSIHLLVPGTRSKICVTEFGVIIYQVEKANMPMDVCKIREISIVQHKIVSRKDFRIDGCQPPLLSEHDSSPTSGRYVFTIPEQETGTDWRYYFELSSLDCWIYSPKTQYQTYSSRQYPFDRLHTVPRPISPSTCGLMINTSRIGDRHQGLGIKLLTWDRNQRVLQEVVADMLDGEELEELEAESFLRAEYLRDENAVMGRILLSPPHWPWLANESFFILATWRKITVYCFDRKFALANEDLSFRREREEKARARRAKRVHALCGLDGVEGCPTSRLASDGL